VRVAGFLGVKKKFPAILRHHGGKKKKKKQWQTVSQVRPTVLRIRTVPDWTAGERYANGVNNSTNTQHGRIGVGEQLCGCRRLAWSLCGREQHNNYKITVRVELEFAENCRKMSAEYH
jgi:hypothetical protein